VVSDDHNQYDGKPGSIRGIRGERHRLRGPVRIDPPAAGYPVPASRPGETSRLSEASLPSKTQRPIAPARASKPAPAKKRVLFVCIGNSCRSQMAEAFARAYGSDVMEVHSAGVSPATIIAPMTRQTLAERNLNVEGHFPKGMDLIRRMPFDIVVNMSGIPVVLPGARVIEWVVTDPIGQSDAVYRTVASRLEGLVMRLILELRSAH
jgi:arsenate reductase